MRFINKVLVLVVFLLFAGADFSWAVVSNNGIGGSGVYNVAAYQGLATPPSYSMPSSFSTRGSYGKSGIVQGRQASASYVKSYGSSYSHTKALYSITGSMRYKSVGASGENAGSTNVGRTGRGASVNTNLSGSTVVGAAYFNPSTALHNQQSSLYQQQNGFFSAHNRAEASLILLGSGGIRRVPVYNEDDDKWYDNETGEECDAPSYPAGYVDPETGKEWNGSTWVEPSPEIFPLGSAPWLLVMMIGAYLSFKRIRRKE